MSITSHGKFLVYLVLDKIIFITVFDFTFRTTHWELPAQQPAQPPAQPIYPQVPQPVQQQPYAPYPQGQPYPQPGHPYPQAGQAYPQPPAHPHPQYPQAPAVPQMTTCPIAQPSLVATAPPPAYPPAQPYPQ